MRVRLYLYLLARKEVESEEVEESLPAIYSPMDEGSKVVDILYVKVLGV